MVLSGPFEELPIRSLSVSGPDLSTTDLTGAPARLPAGSVFSVPGSAGSSGVSLVSVGVGVSAACAPTNSGFARTTNSSAVDKTAAIRVSAAWNLVLVCEIRI